MKGNLKYCSSLPPSLILSAISEELQLSAKGERSRTDRGLGSRQSRKFFASMSLLGYLFIS